MQSNEPWVVARDLAAIVLLYGCGFAHIRSFVVKGQGHTVQPILAHQRKSGKRTLCPSAQDCCSERAGLHWALPLNWRHDPLFRGIREGAEPPPNSKGVFEQTRHQLDYHRL